MRYSVCVNSTTSGGFVLTHVHLTPFHPSTTDVHTVASLLKLYLRELPEPVIPFARYEDFLSCAQLLTKDEGEVSASRDTSWGWDGGAVGLWHIGPGRKAGRLLWGGKVGPQVLCSLCRTRIFLVFITEVEEGVGVECGSLLTQGTQFWPPHSGCFCFTFVSHC